MYIHFFRKVHVAKLTDEDKQLLLDTTSQVQELKSLLRETNKEKSDSISSKGMKRIHKLASKGKQK